MQKEEDKNLVFKKQHIFTKHHISESSKLGLGLGLGIPFLILLIVILFRFNKSQAFDLYADHPDFMDITRPNRTSRI